MPALLPAYHAASRGTRQPAAVLSSRQSFLWKKNLTPCAACARKLLTHRVCCGEVAQLGEHRLRKAGVEGSNPFFSTTNFQRARKLSACEPFSVAVSVSAACSISVRKISPCQQWAGSVCALPAFFILMTSKQLLTGVLLEDFQFEMLCVSNYTACRFAEKRGFSAHSGQGGAVPPPRVSPFSKLKHSNRLIGSGPVEYRPDRGRIVNVKLQFTKNGKSVLKLDRMQKKNDFL